eukprot:SAG11_NODE_5174_length_1640_cov_1.878001_3_plen_54_part_00
MMEDTDGFVSVRTDMIDVVEYGGLIAKISIFIRSTTVSLHRLHISAVYNFELI